SLSPRSAGRTPSTPTTAPSAGAAAARSPRSSWAVVASTSALAVRPEAVGSGAAEGLVAVAPAGSGGGVALEPGALVEGLGQHLDEALEGGEVAVGAGGKGLLHEVVAGDVDGVDPVHLRRRLRRVPPD